MMRCTISHRLNPIDIMKDLSLSLLTRSLARLLVRSPRLDMARLQIIRKNRADAAEKKALLADAAAEKKAAAGRR